MIDTTTARLAERAMTRARILDQAAKTINRPGGTPPAPHHPPDSPARTASPAPGGRAADAATPGTTPRPTTTPVLAAAARPPDRPKRRARERSAASHAVQQVRPVDLGLIQQAQVLTPPAAARNPTRLKEHHL